MSTQALTGLRDYLTGTLSVADMNWLANELTEFAKKEEEFPLKRYTMEEINSMLDIAEADIAAGRVIDDEDAWDDLDEELAREKKLEQAETI